MRIKIEDKRFSASEIETILRERAALLAHVEREEADQGQQIPMIGFCLKQSKYAVPAQSISGIGRVDTLVGLVNTPDFVVGCVYWEGSIIAVVDLAKWWGSEGNSSHQPNWMMVLTHENYYVGILVDDFLAQEFYYSKQVLLLAQTSVTKFDEIDGYLPNDIALINVKKFCAHLVERIKK
jgi:chemotaxis signal transduction protein